MLVASRCNQGTICSATPKGNEYNDKQMWQIAHTHLDCIYFTRSLSPFFISLDHGFQDSNNCSARRTVDVSGVREDKQLEEVNGLRQIQSFCAVY